VSRTGNALAEYPRQRLVVIFGPHQGLMIRHKPPGEFMVAIFALISETFLQPGSQASTRATLGLCQTPRGLPEFLGVRDLFARRERQECLKPRVHAYLGMT
jgi:hypothetical protein